MTPTEKFNQLTAQALSLSLAGRLQDAIEVAAQAADFAQTRFGEQDECYAIALGHLALFFERAGLHQEAADSNLRAWHSLRPGPHRISKTSARILTQLGGNCWELGRLADAVAVCQEAVNVQFHLQGQDHPDTADSLCNLGMVYLQMEKVDDARRCLYEAKRVLAIHFPSAAQPSPAVLKCSLALADLYDACHESQKALAERRLIVELQRRINGERSTGYAAALSNLATHLYKAGKVDSSRPLYEQALTLSRSLLGERHGNVAICLNNLANVYRDLGELEAAIPLYLEALHMRVALLGPEHSSVEINRRDFGQLFDAIKARPDSGHWLEILYQQMRAVSPFGPRHWFHRNALVGLLELYMDREDFAAALPLSEEIVALSEAAGTVYEPEHATVLGNLAAVHKGLGNWKKSESLYKESLHLRCKLYGSEDPNHPAIVKSRTYLAELYYQMGRYVEAEQIYEAALPLLSASDLLARGSVSTSYGLTCWRLGKLQTAARLLQDACALARQHSGEQSQDYATSHQNLALLWEEQGDYAAALALRQSALSILRKLPSARSASVPNALRSLGSLYKTMGELAAAEPLLEEALQLARDEWAPTHPNLVLMKNDLAILYMAQDKFALAEGLFLEAIATASQSDTERSPHMRTLLRNLAGLYVRMHSYAQADAALSKALALGQRLAEPDLERARTLFALARLRRATKRYSDAASLYREGAELLERSVGEEHPDFTQALTEAGSLYAGLGLADAAEEQLQRALAIRNRHSGPAQGQLSLIRDALAEIKWRRGQKDEAIALLQQTAEERRVKSGEHADYAMTIGRLAYFYAAVHRPKQALALLKQVTEIEDANLGQVTAVASRQQQQSYVASLQSTLQKILSLVLGELRESPEALAYLFELILRRKALGLESVGVQRESLLRARHPDLLEELDKLNALRRRISHFRRQGPDGMELAAYREQVGKWYAEADQIERELARKSPEVALARRLREASRQKVAAALDKSSALIEILRFEPLSFVDDEDRGQAKLRPGRYVAMTMLGQQPDSLQLFDLGPATDIDQKVNQWRAAVSGSAESAAQPERPLFRPSAPTEQPGSGAAERWLYDVLFAPLAKAVQGCRNLLVVPDGELSRFPFAGLRRPDGKFLIDDFRITYLATGRDVLRLQTRRPAPGPTLVVGDPAYELVSPPGELPPATAELRGIGLRGQLQSFPALPGTRAEALAIAEALGVDPVLGAAAVKAILFGVHSPRVLHLATHGFFLPDLKPPPARLAREPGDSSPKYVHTMRFLSIPGHGKYLAEVENAPWNEDSASSDHDREGRMRHLESPMLRSGLVLAGANTWLRGAVPPAEAQDGFLSAEEAATLDLADTELVVLSACETGLGDIHVGEGVIGLGRAFLMAGAGAVIMSLWRVSDQQTKTLMVDFHRRVLAGRQPADALRDAQLSLKQRHPSPGSWSAFIYCGNVAAKS